MWRELAFCPIQWLSCKQRSTCRRELSAVLKLRGTIRTSSSHLRMNPLDVFSQTLLLFKGLTTLRTRMLNLRLLLPSLSLPLLGSVKSITWQPIGDSCLTWSLTFRVKGSLQLRFLDGFLSAFSYFQPMRKSLLLCCFALTYYHRSFYPVISLNWYYRKCGRPAASPQHSPRKDGERGREGAVPQGCGRRLKVGEAPRVKMGGRVYFRSQDTRAQTKTRNHQQEHDFCCSVSVATACLWERVKRGKF